jgi:four helix bundle protein
MEGQYFTLKNLQIYQLAAELSKIAWKIYSRFNWQTKKIIGDQFIESTDSVGANIAEGYYRYHYLDKIKFYYNARASHGEAVYHWLKLLLERNLIDIRDYEEMIKISEEFAPRFNKYINSVYEMRNNEKR